MTSVRDDRNAAPATVSEGRPLHRYIPEFDVLRGVAIVLVVYLHAWFSPWDTTPHREVLWVHVVHLFAETAVPVFFFVSAYLLAQDRSPNWRNFAWRKVGRIAIPTLFWMTAALLFEAWQAGAVTGGLLKAYACFDIAGQYYYLLVLIVFMAAFWPLRGWSAARMAKIAALAFVANLAMIAWYQAHAVSGDWVTLEYRNPLVWVFFYAFGFWAGRRFESLAWTRRLLWPGTAAMLAVAAVYFARGEAFDRYPRSYFGVEIFLFSAAALVTYPALIQLVARTGGARGRALLAPFRSLARFSFGIYLVQMPFFIGWVSTRLVSNDPHLNQDYWVLMNAIFVAGFGSAAAFVIALDRVAPAIAEAILGTNPPKVQRGPRLKATKARTRSYRAPPESI